MNNTQWLKRLIAAAALPLAACGGTDTVVEDREISVETMPVNGDTLGFWIMQTETCLDGAAAICINDNSPYSNDLVLEDASLQPVAERYMERGNSDIGGKIIQINADDEALPAQLRTPEDSLFAATPIGEVFAIHLRFKPAAGEALQTLMSLGTGVFNVEAGSASVVVQFPVQGKRLLLPLEGPERWNELYIVSDGQNVSLQLNCEDGPGFGKTAGAPLLSRTASALMLGARPTTPASEHFSGQVDLLRVSRVNEANLFCQ